jgi:hypothetical protein
MSEVSQSKASRVASSARSVIVSNLLLRKQIWIWPLLAGVVLFGIGWWVRSAVETAVKDGIEGNLQVIRDAEVEALRIWLATQEANAEAGAHEPHIRSAITQLVDLAATAEEPAAALRESEALKELRNELEPWIEAHDYEGFAVIDHERRIVAAVQESLVGNATLAKDAAFLDKVFQGETIVSVPFKSAILLKDNDGKERVGLPTMFALAPVTDGDGQVIAALGLRIRPDDEFTQILSIAQAGKTGETYAFDKTGLLISESRFDDNLKAIGLITDDETTRSVLNVQIRDPQVDMSLGRRPKLRRSEQPLTRMAEDAVAGNSGVDVDGYRDYRGVPVVGAWAWLPNYDFGVTTELDVAEAYRPLYILRRAFWGLFGLLAASSVAIFVFSLVVAKLERKARRASLEAKQLGQYSLDKKIGAGGMGVVYRAHHGMLQRPTAVKLLDVEKTNAETIARFEREVRLTAQLNHPNTIAIYDYGHTPEGVFYYAMEYLDGITLDDLVKKFGPQPDGRVIRILRQLCGSLAEAHGVGLIHRDVKPANIILNQRGGMFDVVKLLDFGLVKAVDAKQFAALTTSGSLTGTPLYMSPEAIETPTKIDTRSDLYAVGAVGYYLLTGGPVFEGESVIEICAQHVQATPQPPSERAGRKIDPDLEAVVLKCLAKQPDDRPATAEALDDELSRCPAATLWTRADARQWWRQNFATEGEAEPAAEPTSSGAVDQTMILDRG